MEQYELKLLLEYIYDYEEDQERAKKGGASKSMSESFINNGGTLKHFFNAFPELDSTGRVINNVRGKIINRIKRIYGKDHEYVKKILELENKK